MNKFIRFFYEKNDPYNITKCWHGFCYNDMIRNKIHTCIFPLNFIVAIVRSFYYMIKSAGYGADEFYRHQISMRSLRKMKQKDFNNTNLKATNNDK